MGEGEAKEKRNVAKSINFGLLYGMGPRKLSGELGISANEAKEIIVSYFNSFPTVKSFLESIEEEVKHSGYVLYAFGIVEDFLTMIMQTVWKKLPYLREGVNTVFQGSAADLIKLSMNLIDSMIIEEQLDATLLLQIHDELIFEVKEDVAEDLAQKFAHAMEHIYKLSIPLECSVSIGDNWGELK